MIVVDDNVIETTEQGFLLRSSEWNERVAAVLAAGAGVELTAAHWEIVLFIRDYFLTYRHLPNARMFVKAVQRTLGEQKGNSRYLYRLFPESPLKQSCLIAGLPKPPSCI
jgi:tRNA 2-thiouridine synthesizing protein E